MAFDLDWYSVAVRALGLLFLIDLAALLPFFREAFAFGDRAGERSAEWKRWGLGCGWALGAGCLLSGVSAAILPGALILWVFFRRQFIAKRWKTVRRGFGAPGFMSHFAVLYLVVFEVARCLDPTGELTRLGFLVFRIDLGVIMICAGVYKASVGFYRGEGMEYGTVNPIWGYAWRPLSKVRPDSWFFQMNNIFGSAVEIVAGLLLLFPATQWIGALMVSASFLYVGLLVRLGRLAVLMAVLPVFCFPAVIESAVAMPPALSVAVPGWVVAGGSAVLIAFLVMLPIVKFVQYYNLFGNRRLPEPWQKWIAGYANWMPIIMWRVFTPDVTNFYFRIRGRRSDAEDWRPLVVESTFDWTGWKRPLAKLRTWHVTESIAVVSVFTLRKYYPSKPELFRERLLTYSDSLRGAFGMDLVEFEYECVAIRKAPTCFKYEPVRRFLVDVDVGSVVEEQFLGDDPTSKPARFSPVRESVLAGTYAR